MKYIKSYFSRYKINFILAAVFAVIFCSVFALADLPLATVGYAFLLCASAFAVFIAVDIGMFVRRVKQLERAKDELPDALRDLPKPNDETERIYGEMLLKLHKAYEKGTLEHAKSESVMLEYYTLWVHQIKTPISALRLLLKSGGEPDIGEIENEIFRIEQYVEMALCYQRVEAGGDLMIKRYPLDGIVRKAIRKYSKQFIRKKLKLQYVPTDIEVITDEKWLGFVIEQIFSNALKYTRSGSITVLTEGYTLKISDTGIGIAEEDLPRIFECGFTGYNGRAYKKSTGIGLYLCDKICRKLCHRISITSAVGQGTCVSIDLGKNELGVE